MNRRDFLRAVAGVAAWLGLRKVPKAAPTEFDSPYGDPIVWNMDEFSDSFWRSRHEIEFDVDRQHTEYMAWQKMGLEPHIRDWPVIPGDDVVIVYKLPEHPQCRSWYGSHDA
jgi:hypothetical protein